MPSSLEAIVHRQLTPQTKFAFALNFGCQSKERSNTSNEPFQQRTSGRWSQRCCCSSIRRPFVLHSSSHSSLKALVAWQCQPFTCSRTVIYHSTNLLTGIPLDSSLVGVCRCVPFAQSSTNSLLRRNNTVRGSRSLRRQRLQGPSLQTSSLPCLPPTPTTHPNHPPPCPT